MPIGEYRSLKIPKGPLFDNRRYNIKPSVTVGIPSIALKNPLTRRFPRKDERPRTRAIGKPHTHEIIVAKPEIKIDLNVMESISELPLQIKYNA